MITNLLDSPPFAARDDAAFLNGMNEICSWHLAGCPEYRRVWPDWSEAGRIEDLPFLHVGVFKRQLWKTAAEGITHQRTLRSSSTSQATASMIALDDRSSALQAQSSAAILKELVGESLRPLLILDTTLSLRQRGQASARITAAMSLRFLASEIHFLMDNAEDAINWDRLIPVLARHKRLLVYGFTWMLWRAWATATVPDQVRQSLASTEVHFVHSGGWKKLEAARVDRKQFAAALLATVGPASKVTDYYGLVEQVGVIFPLCEAGFYHVPRWAGVLVRDPWTLESLADRPGLLQFMNILSWGAPYHSVLTEDLGRLVPGDCACKRCGQRFELIGRVPKAEIRGCANV
jgi:Acyl-protein synthetase, LuxE